MPLSTAAREAIYASQTGEVFLVLLTLEHSTLPIPIRVSSDGIDTNSRGERYQHFGFRVTMPAEDEQSVLGDARLAIDNVDRTIVTALRTAAASQAPISVTLEVVLASSPDTIEHGPFVFALRDAQYNAATVEGRLEFDDLLNAACPADAFTPGDYPGLFA